MKRHRRSPRVAPTVTDRHTPTLSVQDVEHHLKTAERRAERRAEVEDLPLADCYREAIARARTQLRQEAYRKAWER